MLGDVEEQVEPFGDGSDHFDRQPPREAVVVARCHDERRTPASLLMTSNRITVEPDDVAAFRYVSPSFSCL